MGTAGKNCKERSPRYWKELGAGTNLAGSQGADAKAKTVNTAVTDTLQGSMRTYFIKQAAVSGMDWRDAKRKLGLR